ncbi:MAG: hypothetical protein RIA71_01330 [Oceanicaulis sp.]
MTESDNEDIDLGLDEAGSAAAWLQERFEKMEQAALSKEAMGEDSSSERGHAANFLAALRAIKELQAKVSGLEDQVSQVGRSQSPSKVGGRIGNLDDLPAEIRDQLKSANTDELENQIIEVIKEDFDEAASVDEILVGLYRRFTRIEDREQLSRKLYRMTRKELIRALPKRRGIYEIVEN